MANDYTVYWVGKKGLGTVVKGQRIIPRGE